MGPKNAPITIIEFTDYECPFCGRVRPTITQIMDKYKGKVRYVLRDYPLPFHGNAKKASEAAHCAGDQKKYWEMNKLLFQNQKTLGVGELKKYAKDIGLNTGKFDKCLDSGKYTKKVDENQAYGSKVGVNGTPAFFINGIVLSGAQPVGAFTEIIDAELADKK
jgi:protein-disulfide isomerase